MWGPASFTKEEYEAYRERADIQSARAEVAEKIRMIVTSVGAGPDNFCIRALTRAGSGAELPPAVAGEVLFNVFDATGQTVSFSAPVFTLFEGSAIPNTKLRDLALSICREQKIKHQVTFLARGGTDAGRIHVHARGVPCLVLGVPTRHIHTPAGIMHTDDYDATLKLTLELIKALDAKTVASLTTR